MKTLPAGVAARECRVALALTLAGSLSLDVLMLRERQTRGRRQAASYVRESGEPSMVPG